MHLKRQSNHYFFVIFVCCTSDYDTISLSYFTHLIPLYYMITLYLSTLIVIVLMIKILYLYLVIFMSFLFTILLFYSFPYGFSYLALLTTILFVLHACMHLWNVYEVPAYESGLINTSNPRIGLGSFSNTSNNINYHSYYQQHSSSYQQQQDQQNNHIQQQQQQQHRNQVSATSPSSSSSSITTIQRQISSPPTPSHQTPSSPFISTPQLSSSQKSTSLLPSPLPLLENKSRFRSFSHNTPLSSNHHPQQQLLLNMNKLKSPSPYSDSYNHSHNNYSQNLPSVFPSLPTLPLKLNPQKQHVKR